MQEGIFKESILDAQIQGLTAQSEFSYGYNINSLSVRPCVARIWHTGFERGSLLNRSMACSILASEFIKLNYIQARVEKELFSWNKKNSPPLRHSEIQSTLRTALRKTYNYSCNHNFIQEFCIGSDICMWSKGNVEVKKYNFRAFFNYRWQSILSHIGKLIYWLALPEIEIRRGYRRGSKLFVSHREIARYSGISNKYVRKGLEELFNYKLIDYKPGTSRRWEKNATEVRRIFPIPKPPKEALLKLDK
jgi:hypothetical protein